MQITIVLLGDQQDLKFSVGNKILKDNRFQPLAPHAKEETCVKEEKDGTVVINTPNLLSSKECIIDLMAKSHPGPDAFLLVLADWQLPEEELKKWEKHIQQSNMFHNTIFFTKNKQQRKKAALGKKCLDIDIGGLHDVIKICKENIGYPYRYTYNSVNTEDAVIQRKRQIENEFHAKR